MARSDLSLRRMIAELAEMPDRTCQAVLSELDESQRDKVRALLDEYGGQTPDAPRLPLGRGDLPPGLSAWLADLLADPDTAGEHPEPRAQLTAHTHDALRACAAELRQTPGTGGEPYKPSRWQILRGRTLFTRAGRAAR